MRAIGAFFTIIGVVVSAVVIMIAVMCWYENKVGCSDYLKLAGDAPTVQKANEFLEKAIGYIEDQNLTRGDSAILFHNLPSCDIGIWYNQIKGAQQTLASIIAKGDSATQLEKDNALMKVREVVLDQGEGGTRVTMPANIQFFPWQELFCFTSVVGGIFFVVGLLIFKVAPRPSFFDSWSRGR